VRDELVAENNEMKESQMGKESLDKKKLGFVNVTALTRVRDQSEELNSVATAHYREKRQRQDLLK
jgi:hypothetical protein